MPDKKYKLTVLKDAQGKYVLVDGKRYRLPNDSRITNQKFKQIIIRNIIHNNADKKIVIRRKRKSSPKAPNVVPSKVPTATAPTSVSAPITVANPFYETDKIKMNAEADKLKEKYNSIEKEQKTVLEKLEAKNEQEREKNNQQLLEFQHRLNQQALEYNNVRNEFIAKLQERNADPELLRSIRGVDRKMDDFSMAFSQYAPKIAEKQDILVSSNASTTVENNKIERNKLLIKFQELNIGPDMTKKYDKPKLTNQTTRQYLDHLNVSNEDLSIILRDRMTATKLINYLVERGYLKEKAEPKAQEPKKPEPPKTPEPKTPDKVNTPVEQPKTPIKPKAPEKPKEQPNDDEIKQMKINLEKGKVDLAQAEKDIQEFDKDIFTLRNLLTQKSTSEKTKEGVKRSIQNKEEYKKEVQQQAIELANWIRNIEQEINRMNGQGRKTDDNGIYSNEIDSFMNVFAPRNYLGAVSYDRLANILELSFIPKEFSIIINEDSSKEAGSHWVAIFKTPKTIEYYDPFGKPPMPEIKNFIYALTKKLNNNIQIKINAIPNQSINSSNCGYLCMRFIVDRYAGESFIQSTHYDSVQKSEREVERWKNDILNFESI